MIATIEVQSTNFDKQCQITPVICTKKRSGQRDSNPRPSAWEADALPAELCPPAHKLYREGVPFARIRSSSRCNFYGHKIFIKASKQLTIAMLIVKKGLRYFLKLLVGYAEFFLESFVVNFCNDNLVGRNFADYVFQLIN